MANYPDDIPLKPRRFSVVPSSPEEPVDAPSEPIVLALLVAEVLREAKLGNAVLEMRASPVGRVSFLVELDSLLREDARDWRCRPYNPNARRSCRSGQEETLAELEPGDVRVYLRRHIDLARTIDPTAWSDHASPEAWRRRIRALGNALDRIEAEETGRPNTVRKWR